MNNDWSLIILAAGKGTRLGGTIPKPLVKLAGTYLIQPFIEKAFALEIPHIFIAISEFTEQIKEVFPDPRLTYVMTDPLGTGHCAQVALQQVPTSQVLIGQADDSFFYSAETLQNLMQQHEQTGADFTVGLAEIIPVADQKPSSYDQVIHDETGKISAITRPDHPTTKDINAGIYAAKTSWLQAELPGIPLNAQGEKGLPTVAEVGLQTGADMRAFKIPLGQWFGVNTQEELQCAEEKVHSEK